MGNSWVTSTFTNTGSAQSFRYSRLIGGSVKRRHLFLYVASFSFHSKSDVSPFVSKFINLNTEQSHPDPVALLGYQCVTYVSGRTD